LCISKYDQFDLKRVVQDVMALVGAFNLADYVPWLGVFDLQVCDKIKNKGLNIGYVILVMIFLIVRLCSIVLS
jgi:hypothetical protein